MKIKDTQYIQRLMFESMSAATATASASATIKHGSVKENWWCQCSQMSNF